MLIRYIISSGGIMKNKTDHNEYMRKWRKNNKEKVKLINKKSYEKK
jgi:hypothetical protein